MFSATKQEDRLLLHEIGEMVITLTKFLSHPGVIDLIEGYGKSYEELETRISTHDYTYEDFLENNIMNNFKKW